MLTDTKKELGQFYTKNAEYIIQNLLSFIPATIKSIIDPFAGAGDLLNMSPPQFSNIGYDLIPMKEGIIQRDTLLEPPTYTDNDWIFTNPPYLAKNKTKNKDVFEKYKVDDLYLAALLSVDGCGGGTFILPAGFFSNSNVVFRKGFLSKYLVHKIYFFEEQVFSDTTYAVCSFSFSRGCGINVPIPVVFMPTQTESTIIFNEYNNYTFGGEIFPSIPIKIKRLTAGMTPNSRIKLYAVDSGTYNGRIRLTLEEPFVGKSTDRAFATLVFPRALTIEEEEYIVNTFNSQLDAYRAKYNSMFLSNYRNATKNGARKRIGFEQAYNLVQQIFNSL